MRFELRYPGTASVILDPGAVIHQSSVLHETVYGVSSALHTFNAITTDYVDDLLRQSMSTGTPRLRFRLGVGDPDTAFWLPWQDHVIVNYAAALISGNETAGHTINIATADPLHLLRRETRAAAHNGPISRIVEDILDRFGLFDRVIEPTDGPGAYVQSFSTDEQFIRERLLPRARNPRNRGAYYFYARDGVVHFHCADYQAGFGQIVYYQSNQDSLALADHSQTLLPEGAADASIIVHDPYTGKSSQLSAAPGAALRLAEAVYATAKLLSTGPNLDAHLSANSMAHALNRAQNAYESARRRTFTVKANLVKTIGLRAGDIIRLVIAPREDRTSPWTGLYLLAGVGHKIDSGEITTEYTFERGEIAPIRQAVSGWAGPADNEDDELVSELEAPGEDVNLSEVNASGLTKGAGQQESQRTFATVSDPDSVV